MSNSSRALPLPIALLAITASLPAHAELSITRGATQNVSCSGRRCVATASDAVMNVRELRQLLASQMRVTLDAGPAKNIAVNAPLSWTSASTLELKARHALTVNKPVTVAGAGGVTIQAEEGALSFAPKASLTLWNLSSKLAINGLAYTLVGDIKSLNYYVSTPVALARDYDASADTEQTNPIQYIQSPHGRFEGLGHTVSHLTIEGNGYPGSGFVGRNDGVLSNLRLDGQLLGGDKGGFAVGSNTGLTEHVAVRVTIISDPSTEMAGLAAENYGVIRDSSARVNIRLGATQYTGGLVAINGGTISTSWVEGTVHGGSSNVQLVGGLAALNAGAIQNSYSLADVKFFRGYHWDIAHGGLIGQTSTTAYYPSSVVAAYAAGATAPRKAPPMAYNVLPYEGFAFAGSVVGFDGTSSTFQSTYWATDVSCHHPNKAAGNKTQLAGATGLTQAQLKSALPAGFDPKVWGQSPTINNNFPYLLSNPPQ